MRRIFFGAIALANFNHAFAGEQVPLWEAGAGVAALTLPAYRGSEKIHTFVLPVPYFTYHGDILKADRHGVRGELFDSDRIELSISTSASPPTQSDDIDARENMPDLEPTVEIGPELDITLWRDSDSRRDGDLAILKLRLPVRQAFVVDDKPRDIGIIFSPNLNADFRSPFGLQGWNLGLVTGPIFASARQNAYFYEVDAQYATASRPAYTAHGGYGGWQFLASVSKRFDNVWFGAYIRQDTLQGAVFIDSPLVEKRSYTSAGFAISWIFGRSNEMVELDDE
jgi:MipA family protein